MKIAALVVVLMMCLMACSSLTGSHNRTPPLPAVEMIACCWQSEEEVTLTDAQGVTSLHAVIAREGSKLTVLMLDSLGHRQLTLVRQQQTQVLGEPDNWNPVLNNYLLLAIFLHHSSSTTWVANNPDYSVRLQPGKKSLLFKGNFLAAITYDASPNDISAYDNNTYENATHDTQTTPEFAQPRSVQFAGLPLTLHVTTLSRQPL